MSDGGRERRRDHDDPKQHRKYGNDEFARAIVKVAVSQICGGEGFQAFQQSALETLSDVAIRYMIHLGKTAASSANSAGRTEVNAFDIIHGLEDLGSGVGFSGGSNIDHCLAQSGIVKEVLQYVGDAEEIPFAYPLPPIPVLKDRKQGPSFVQAGEEPPREHIPSWLPKFPDPQSYDDKSPNQREKSLDPNDITGEKEKSSRKTLHSLSNLHQRYACNGSGLSAEVKEIGETNPFLRLPLHFGEKEVSPADHPLKLSNDVFLGNHMEGKRLLDTFAPAIEAVRGLAGECNVGQKFLSNQRPALQFKIKTGKKSFGLNRDLKHPRPSSDEVNDDKRKRAKEILEESLENLQGPS